MRQIQKAMVLGAGMMGSQIAAHLANAGIPVLLLDIVPGDLGPDESRSTRAQTALRRLAEQRPAPLMHRDVGRLIAPGNVEDDLGRVDEVDWVLEAVVERMDAKQALWTRVAARARPGTILSSNSSGLSIRAQAEALPPEQRRAFLGTHFFNPPRYLKLLEVIPTRETAPEVVALVQAFAERRLGKGVVVCNDTPNFIANRIGTYGFMATLRAMDELGLGVDEVDAITGPVLGRPRSATFRTLDVVGLDTLLHVLRNGAAATDDLEERALLEVPAYLQAMVERGWTGEKIGQGFYRKAQGRDGSSEILTLDLKTMEYGPRARTTLVGLEQARSIKDYGERLRMLISAPDRAGQFVWRTLSRVLVFCAAKAQEIANGDVNAIDRAMRWGYGWEYGPFESWNAIGVQESVARMQAEGLAVPEWVKTIEQFPVERRGEQPLEFPTPAVERTRIVRSTPGATLVDLGEEVLGLHFHSPKQAIGQDYLLMARAVAGEVRANWRGLVIGASASNFCVGANLLAMLIEAQDENWDDLERAIRELQSINMLLKYLPRPVVVAPYGITVGGGTEVAMHCARTVAAAESYLGLVEVSVGLIPGGGGTKEMALRAAQLLPAGETQLPNQPDLAGLVARVFEQIATAKVSTSAAEARDMLYLRPTDPIVMNRDLLLMEARQTVLELDRAGYGTPLPLDVPIAGPDGRAVLELAAYTLKNSGYATEHDLYIARKLAYVLTGGELAAGSRVPEQYLLDLEREAFLHLCGHPRTQARMVHMLQKNKPLRN